MEKKYPNFPIKEAQQLAETPTGQMLIKQLQHSGVQLDEAAKLMKQGNTQQAAAILQPIMEDPNIQALLRQLGG